MDQYPKRKRNRIDGFDYSTDGAYYITVCTRDHLRIFWDTVGADTIRPEDVPLSEIGKVVEQGVFQIARHYDGVYVDNYCIMPDHIHLLLRIEGESDGRMISAPTRGMEGGRMVSAPTVSTVVGSLKRWVSRQVGTSIWQKSFYDHCIRNQRDYDETWKYIEENPLKYKLGYRRGGAGD